MRGSQDPGARMYDEQWVRRQEANTPALQPVARGNSGGSRRRVSLELCASCLGLVGSSKLGSGWGGWCIRTHMGRVSGGERLSFDLFYWNSAQDSIGV